MHIKPTVILIHGAGGSALSWGFLKREITDSINFRAIDLPGHGNIQGEGCNTIEEYVCFVEKYVTDNKIFNFYLAGHSLGGAIALSYALKRSDNLKGLILIGTGAKLKVLSSILNGIKEDYKNIAKMIVDYCYFNKELVSQGVYEMLKNKPALLFNDFSACNNFDETKRLSEITVPTLVICGKNDIMTPIKYSTFLSENINNSKLHFINDAGHMVMIEKPKELAKCIKEFVIK